MYYFYTNDVHVVIMIPFNYFGLSHSPFLWINTSKLTQINIKIWVNKERVLIFNHFEKLL